MSEVCQNLEFFLLYYANQLLKSSQNIIEITQKTRISMKIEKYHCIANCNIVAIKIHISHYLYIWIGFLPGA